MTAAKMHFLETTQSIMHNIVCIIVAQWPGNFKNSGSDLVLKYLQRLKSTIFKGENGYFCTIFFHFLEHCPIQVSVLFLLFTTRGV